MIHLLRFDTVRSRGIAAVFGAMLCCFAFAHRAVAAPINDNFANANAISGGIGSASGSNVGATSESLEPNHVGNAGGKSVWWTWTAPAKGFVMFDTRGSNFDTQLAAYTGAAVNSLTEVASNEDENFPGGIYTSFVGFNTSAGVVYRIAVDGYHGATGSISLNWLLFQRPANDDFASAFAIAGALGTTTGTNFNATVETGEPNHVGDAGGKSVWWVWTAPAAGLAEFNTRGSNFDTQLAVYTGAVVSALAETASNEDENYTSGIYTSLVTFNTSAGIVYHIAVDGYMGETGDVILNWQLNSGATPTPVPTPTAHPTPTAPPTPTASPMPTATPTPFPAFIPVNLDPPNSASLVTLMPELRASDLLSSNPLDLHTASYWEIYQATLDSSGSVVYIPYCWALTTNTLTSLAVPYGYLSDRADYVWHVSYYFSISGWTDWSTTTSFALDATPTNLAPPNAALDVSLTPILSADDLQPSDVSNPHIATYWEVYYVPISASFTVSSSIFTYGVYTTDTLTTTALPAGILFPNSYYLWDVIYFYEKTGWSEWSHPTWFKTKGRPVNIAPPNGTVDVSLTPVLQASDVQFDDPGNQHAISYWEIYRVLPFSAYSYDAVFSGASYDTLTTFSVPAGILENDQIYDWRVSYYFTETGWSEWSYDTTFTTRLSPGLKPINLDPFDTAVDVPLTPTLSASDLTSTDSGNLHDQSQWQVYQLMSIDTYTFDSFPVYDIITSDALISVSLPEGVLDHSALYSWRVAYHFSKTGWTDWSEATVFRTIASGESGNLSFVPTNVSPLNGATSVSLEPTLQASDLRSWDAADQHVMSYWELYQVVLYADGYYGYDLVFYAATTSSLTAIPVPSSALINNAIYSWRVSYYFTKTGWTAWSYSTWFRTIAKAALAPVNLDPPDGATGVFLAPTLRASDLASSDALDLHDQSRWEVFYIFWTSGGAYSPEKLLVYGMDTIDGSTSHALPSGILIGNASYAWHAAYHYSKSGWTDWSDMTYFKTGVIPANLEPPNGAVDVPLTATLRASDIRSSDALNAHDGTEWWVQKVLLSYNPATHESYQYQLVFDTISSDRITTIALPPAVLENGFMYGWTARYHFSRTGWTEWSRPTFFMTIANPQATPTPAPNRTPSPTPSPKPQYKPENLWPGAGDAGIVIAPRLIASQLTPAFNHAGSWWEARAQDSPPDYSVPIFKIFSADTLTTFTIPAGTLNYDSTYAWRVAYVDASGAVSAWSDETTFSTALSGVANHPPDAPANFFPGAGESGVPPNPRLVASAFGDPDSGDFLTAAQWQIRVSTGTYATAAYTTLSSARVHDVPSGYLSGGALCYWHVSYQDSRGAWSPWSPETSFTVVQAGAISAPQGLRAAAGAQSVWLTWQLHSDFRVQGYKAYRSVLEAGPYDLITSPPVRGAEYMDQNLTPGQTYYYRLSVVSDQEESALSAPVPAVVGAARIFMTDMRAMPGRSVTQMITIANPNEISNEGLQINILYDKTQMTPMAINKTALTQAFSMQSNIGQADGELVILSQKTTDLKITGEGNVLQVQYWVNPASTLWSYSPLAFNFVELVDVNAHPVTMDYNSTAGLTVASPVVPGDLNGDGRVTIQDAVTMRMIVLNEIVPSDSQRANGDINGDGLLDNADLVLLTRMILGGGAYPPPLPGGGIVRLADAPASAPCALHWGPQTAAGAGVAIPLILDNLDGVAGFDIVLNFDPARLDLSAIETGGAIPPTCSWRAYVENGQGRLVGADTGGLSGSSGTMALLHFAFKGAVRQAPVTVAKFKASDINGVNLARTRQVTVEDSMIINPLYSVSGTVNYLLGKSIQPPADANGDGRIDTADILYLISH
ncbi:MAG: dockerin type I domain-containing protein [Candidatus Sumerlaeota bacterium]|nr:dockerin type I domain-containing protein [Candidatus Sumerlaeota bacterium]